jgi:hypothetical protein
VKGKDNMLFGDSSSYEFVGDAVVEAVMVEPDVPVTNFSIKNEGVNSLGAVPAFCDDQITSSIVADNDFGGGAVFLLIENGAV